ncbi:hydrolase [Rhodotorula diobovata]|uniref:Hydrolase n=1 Tax=Rhodotorula diobovata TaxID=5288 RepID=A0A5C5G160_9BASI|nr:hydrolase [Rhodotorula diobovata]
MSSTPASTSSRQSTRSSRTPHEDKLVLPLHEDIKDHFQDLELVDTHCHIHSTFQAYKEKYPEGKHANIRDFVAALLQADGSNKLRTCVDVYCEGSDMEHWASTLAALSDFPDLDYRFVAGAHPHEAKNYTDELERRFLEAHRHERCVGWGEIGLDYHYDNSPRDVQQDVLRRQLRTALGSGENKAITIHTREADDDIVRILKEELPREQRVHVHCYTDSPECAASLLSHFPNLFIGITGVVTYSTNVNTPQVIRDLGATCSPSNPAGLRILLETDAPFMPPANMANKQLGMTSKQRFPFAHGGVLPWTAEFVKRVLNEGKGEDEDKWTTAGVLRQARENARLCYGV